MKRNKFSLSHYKLLTCDMGELVPVALTEVLPGDSIQQSTSMLVRVSPLLAPVMHPVHVRIHHWYVPTRIVWPDFEDFITGGPDGMDASVFPTLPAAYVGTEGSLSDYLGIPPGVAIADAVSAIPFRAYAKIWNEWYRDQDLQAELPISEASGVDSTTSVALQKVAWEKDYFTSSRPFTQKGPDVGIPIAGLADVIPQGPGIPGFNNSVGVAALQYNNADDSVLWSNGVQSATGQASWADPALVADLGTTNAVNINELRRAFALQRYEEARARYGSRYTEYLRYLGVRSSDARLQRPEYLGGGKQTIQFSEVLQTGPDTSDEGVANLKGHGIGSVRSNRYRRFFEEHGYVLTLMSVKPKTMYAQSLPRTWSRRTKEDFFQRELQHIGQQEVWNREVYTGHTLQNNLFGWQDRYDEYRRAESSIAGNFRSTLDHWHYARIFASDVTLNSAFVTADPTKRVNAEQTQDCLFVMAIHSIQARRIVARNGSSFIY